MSNPDELLATLAKWVQPSSPPPEIDIEQGGSQEARAEAEHLLPEKLDGIDLEIGLKRAAGNPLLYLEILALFVEDNKEMMRC